MYYFKGDTAKKWFDDLNNGIDFLKKIDSDGIKLEEAKKTLQNLFKSNLH